MDRTHRLLVSQVAVPYLRRHLRRLSRALRGVPSAKDPEAVHQTRVACRRLRAALRVFRNDIGKRTTRRWRKVFRKLGRVFGAARDLDVEIASMLGQMGQVREENILHGLAFWLAHLEEQRHRKQPELIRAIRKFRRKAAILEMGQWIKRQSREMVAAGSSQGGLPVSITKQHRKLLSERLADLLRTAQSLEDPQDIEGHHAMRIAAKKLRYSMEALAPCLGVIGEVTIEALRSLQSHLGEIHDYDVWVERIRQVLDMISGGKFDGPRWLNPDRFMPGLVFLQNKYQELREVRFRQLQNLWHDEKIQGLWQRLQASGFQAISEDNAKYADGARRRADHPDVKTQHP